MELNTIYNEDCLETMKRMPDKFVDLIITDPPYGIGEDGGKRRYNPNRPSYEHKKTVSKYPKGSWDKERVSEEYFREMFRISKHQVIFGGNYYSRYLPPTMGWIFWDKMFENQDFSDGEFIFTSFNKAAWKITMSSKHGTQGGIKRMHPAQKPLKLIKIIVEKFSTGDDLIYDPFMGSGTTLRACKDLGFKYIGSEISKEYCEIAEKRLRQEVLL